MGVHASFSYTANSIESALETAEWLATGKASSSTPAKEPEAKKPAAATASSPNTATQKSSAKKEPAPEKAPAAGATTFDEVRNTVLAVAKEKGPEITRAMMSRFGVAKATELKETQWVGLIEMATQILAGTLDPRDSIAQTEPAEEFA
jgi:hypothetical protein